MKEICIIILDQYDRDGHAWEELLEPLVEDNEGTIIQVEEEEIG